MASGGLADRTRLHTSLADALECLVSKDDEEAPQPGGGTGASSPPQLHYEFVDFNNDAKLELFDSVADEDIGSGSGKLSSTDPQDEHVLVRIAPSAKSACKVRVVQLGVPRTVHST